MAPEGSEERKLARQMLLRSAELSSRTMGRDAWLMKVYYLSPVLVSTAGPDDLEKIANYAWSHRRRESPW